MAQNIFGASLIAAILLRTADLLGLPLPVNLFEKSCDDQARDDYPDRGLAQFAGERCGNSRQSNGRCVANRNGEVREWLFPSARSAGRRNCAADSSARANRKPAWHTSPEGKAEGCGVELELGRPFGTRGLLASNPALKRWAILACPFGTAKQRSSHADKTAPVSV